MNPRLFTDMSGAMLPVILTPADVERLLHDNSAESRLSVLEKVSHHYNDKSFHGREREIAEQIFRLLMKDVTLRVRELLANRLRDNPEAPRDIILHLAHDVESVALPILEASYVLSDADLITIVEESRDMGRLMAISKRQTISARVSEALIDTHYPQVVEVLMANQGANINERSYDKIATEFKENPEIIAGMVSRYPLPKHVVERLVAQVSETVAAELKLRYQLSEKDVQRAKKPARDDVVQQLIEDNLSREQVVRLVDRLEKSDKLTSALAMTALSCGQLYFFTAALARFAGIAVSNAETLIADRGELGFKGLYQKSELPETMFEAARLLLRAVQDLEHGDALPGSSIYANRLVSRVVEMAGDQPVEYLPYFIALIRQGLR